MRPTPVPTLRRVLVLAAALAAADAAFAANSCPPPNAPSDAPGGPTTPLNPTAGGGGPATGGGGGGAGPTAGPGYLPGRTRKDQRVEDLPPATTDPDSSITSWVRWWERNKEQWLRYAERMRKESWTTTPSDTAPRADAANVREEQDALVRDALVPVFLQSLNDGDASVRVSAAMALGRAGDPSAAKPLRERALDDRNPLVRETSLLALGLLGRKADIPYLAERMGDKGLEYRSRAFAALALGLIGGDDAADVLGGAVVDAAKSRANREDLDCTAVLALGLTETAAASDTLLALIRADRYRTSVQAAGFVALGRMDEKRAEVAAATALRRDKQSETRSAAALALGRLATAAEPDIVDLLVKAARDDADPAVRHFSMLSLGRLGGPAVSDRLQVLFAKAKGDDRPFAAIALGMAHVAESGQILRDAFEAERSDSDKSALAIALGLLGDPKAIPLLRKSLDNRRTQWHQAYAATALAMLGDRPSTISIRERFVECRDPDVRQHLAVALGLLGDESAGDDLARLLGRSRSYQDRGAAAMAIGLLRLASKVPLLVATIHDKSEHVTVRACAVSALAQIADPYPVPRLARIVADDDYALGIEPVDRAWALLNRR